MDAMERDRTMAALQMEASAQRDETVALGKLKHSLEATRAHLQRQLRTKEADCDRMTVQIRARLQSLHFIHSNHVLLSTTSHTAVFHAVS